MLSLFSPLNRALAFLGRHGTVAFALSIFVGLALPQLARSMRPMLAITIFIFIMLNFARTDAPNLRATLARPWRFAAACLWTAAAPPLLLATSFLVVPRAAWSPDILLGVAFYAAAPSLMGCPAYASLLGFRNGLITALLFVSLVLSPLISPPLAGLLVGHAVPLDPLQLGLRLLWLVAGAIVAGALLRKLASPARLVAWKHQIDGVGVVCYFLFAIAAMDGVLDSLRVDPGHVLGLLAFCFVLMALMHALTFAAMAWLGPNDVFTTALGTGLRNVGLLIATLGATTPKGTYLFFALSQFPVYMAPLLASPIARLYRARLPAEPAPPATDRAA